MNLIIKQDIDTICQETLPWEKLKNKKIVVTGANGFLASYMIYTLLEKNKSLDLNMTIYAFCRNKNKANAKFGEYQSQSALHIIYQDIMQVIDDKYRSDIIIHAASPSTPYEVNNSPYSVIEANILGYDLLLKKCQAWKCESLMLFSSSSVYGYRTPSDGADENYRAKINFADSKDVYYLSKQMAEMMTASMCQSLKQCNINIVRPFVVFGPGECYSHKKCMTDFLKNAILNEDIVLKSKGDAVRSYIYISDAVRAFFYILLKGNGEAYNVASEYGVCSIKELANLFSSVRTGIKVVSNFKDDKYLDNHSHYIVGKNNKIKRLGWSEKVTLSEGLQRTISWAEDSDFLNS